jgi:hypothetical protein
MENCCALATPGGATGGGGSSSREREWKGFGQQDDQQMQLVPNISEKSVQEC